jgi:hypothetical protein
MWDANYGLDGESYGSRWREASNERATLHVLRIIGATFASLTVSSSDTADGRGFGYEW